MLVITACELWVQSTEDQYRVCVEANEVSFAAKLDLPDLCHQLISTVANKFLESLAILIECEEFILCCANALDKDVIALIIDLELILIEAVSVLLVKADLPTTYSILRVIEEDKVAPTD